MPSRSMRNSFGFSFSSFLSLSLSLSFSLLSLDSWSSSFVPFASPLPLSRLASVPGRSGHQLVLVFFLLDLSFVAQRQERRSFVLAQSDHVNSSGLGIGKLEINIAQNFVEVAVGEKVQIFSVRIEDRSEAVGHAGGDRSDFAVRQRIEMHHRVAILRVLVVRQPLAVGGPGIIQDFAVLPAIDFDLLLVVDVDIPERGSLCRTRPASCCRVTRWERT